MRRLVALLLVTQACAQTPTEPLSVSGIYPHLTVFNSDPKRERPAMECGLGAAVPWAGKLWSTTYTSHDLGEGNDKLFAVNADMSLEIRPESIGGTSACRMIHRESRQLFIASYAIDEFGKVRVIPRDKLPGRLTALARHLTDPVNKVLYLTQDCGGEGHSLALGQEEVAGVARRHLDDVAHFAHVLDRFAQEQFDIACHVLRFSDQPTKGRSAM